MKGRHEPRSGVDRPRSWAVIALVAIMVFMAVLGSLALVQAAVMP